MLESDLRRLRCTAHGVRTQAVPFARPGARIARQFENLIVWCASSMDWTAASVLCRVAWRTVANVVERVVPSSTELSELDGLVHIGVDEISWKRGHKYLTLVIDHDSGKVIWGAKDRTAVTLDAFFDDLGETKTAAIKSVSMDFGAPYAKAVREKAPHAAICLDPFHAVALATKALDQTRRDTWRDMLGVDPDAARRFKGTRFVLLGNPENLTENQAADLRRIQQGGGTIWKAYQLKEALRGIYAEATLSLDESIDLLHAWIDAAQQSGIAPFVKLASTFKQRSQEVINTWIWGTTNARNEGTHSAIRAVFSRAHGFHRADTALAAINLTCGTTPSPTHTQQPPSHPQLHQENQIFSQAPKPRSHPNASSYELARCKLDQLQAVFGGRNQS